MFVFLVFLVGAEARWVLVPSSHRWMKQDEYRVIWYAQADFEGWL
jgi:hypothetical protein